MPTAYRMIALDVDGTLVRPDQSVAPEVVDALAEAEASGILVTLATGRALTETLPAWRQLRRFGEAAPIVVLGGAMVCEPDSGRTLWQHPIAPPVVERFQQAVLDRQASVIAAVDRWRTGHDYLAVLGSDRERIERQWLSRLGLSVGRPARLDTGGSGPEIIRLNAVAAEDDGEGERLARQIGRDFEGELIVRAIHAPNLRLMLIEAFAAGTDKSEGVRYVGQPRRIPLSKAVAIGDDINDVQMLRRAGLGVAMPDAPPQVREAADVVAEDGLGPFLRKLLDGGWG
jgi:hypothetical protein